MELLGAAMPSDVPEDTSPEVTSSMLSEARITKSDASKDALPTESALLTNAGGGDQDEQGEALFIPEKKQRWERR